MKIKNVLFTLVAGLFVLCLANNIDKTNSYNVKAKTTTNESLLYNNIEHDVYNSGLSGAITNNVDAIRFLMTKQAGVNENNLDLYFGLKEKLDLSNSNNSLDLQVRALKNSSNNLYYDTRIKVYIIDNNGAIAAAKKGNAQVTYSNGSTSTVVCENNGDPYQGFLCVVNGQDKFLTQSIRTYSFNKDNFELYSTYSPSASEFNYSYINKVIVETSAPIDNGTYYQYEVMNINSSTNNKKTNLFSAKDAIEGTSRDVLENEWYFDSIPNVAPYSLQQKANIPVLVEKVNANDGGVTLLNNSNKDASYWLRSYGQKENGESDTDNMNSTIDLSKYDHLAFYADTTESESDINVEIKLYWTDQNAVVSSDSNRYFRTGSSSFYYVPDVGNPYYGTIPSGSYIEKGFKGYVYLDLMSFLQDGVGGSYLTNDRLKNIAKNIRFIFNSKTDYKLTNGLDGIGKLKISDVKFVDAVSTNLEIEKIFTKMDLEFDENSSEDEMIQSLPTTISIGADIINSKKMGNHNIDDVIENQYMQLDGSWDVTSIDNDGIVELKFMPDEDSIIQLYNNYSFYNDVSFVFYGFIKRDIDVNISLPSDQLSSEEIKDNSSSSNNDFISDNNSLNTNDSLSLNIDGNYDEIIEKPFDFNILFKIGSIVCGLLLVFEVVVILIKIRRKK